jgi:hypothetical protein
MELLYLAVWCRPFSGYWALPAPSPQCSAATNHLITYAVLNLSSDLAMLVIGFSLFVGSHLPWDRKLILCGVFGIGILVMLCSILNKYYSFTHPFGSGWTFWYVRESSTAMIVANIPFLWTLLRKFFNANAFDGSSDSGLPSVKYHSARSARGRHPKLVVAAKPANGHATSSMVSSQKFSSPAHTRHQSLALDTAAPAKKWKMQGVMGRHDADALAFEPWDYGYEDEDLMADGATVRSDDANSVKTLSDARPKSSKSRRLRDEEAQCVMQEQMTPPDYRDFTGIMHDDEKQDDESLDEKTPTLPTQDTHTEQGDDTEV